jgi:hypothetical protein
MFNRSVFQPLVLIMQRNGIRRALALQSRGAVRNDGLTPMNSTHQLLIEWRARGVHPWDADCTSEEAELLFKEQSIADLDAGLTRLFAELSWIDEIRFRVFPPDSDELLFEGTVARPSVIDARKDVCARKRLWRMGVRV